MAMARPRIRLAGHEADLRIAAVVAVGVIGVQKELSRRNRAGRDRLEGPTVERMRLGATDGLAGQKDRSVYPDRDAHARHAAHRLQIRYR